MRRESLEIPQLTDRHAEHSEQPRMKNWAIGSHISGGGFLYLCLSDFRQTRHFWAYLDHCVLPQSRLP